MTRHKDLKRLVRTRMQKTGESYTAARSQLLKKKSTTSVREPAAVAADHAKIAGMSDAAVQAKTGKTWSEWVEVLDAAGAREMPHRDIANHLHEQHDVPGWWAQMVTVGYERIRGLRDVGQRRDGSYDANKSKTFNVPVGKLYAAFSTKRQREKWLPGVALTVRKATRDKSVRITWEDGTSVETWFTAKGPAKSQVAIQHRRLAGKDEVEARKAYWAERLAALADLLS